MRKRIVCLLCIFVALTALCACNIHPESIKVTDLPQYNLNGNITQITINYDTCDGWYDNYATTDRTQIDMIESALRACRFEKADGDALSGGHTNIILYDENGNSLQINVDSATDVKGEKYYPAGEGLSAAVNSVYEALRMSYKLNVSAPDRALISEIQTSYRSAEYVKIELANGNFEAYLNDIYLGRAHTEKGESFIGFTMRNYDCTLKIRQTD